ncbi:MAG: GNAT family N-acetyltransferase [Rhizomicrobium sp.]
MREDFVYRRGPENAFGAVVRLGDAEPIFIEGPKGIVAHMILLRRLFGTIGVLKALMKVMTRSRFLCGFVSGDRIVSHVWATAVGRRYPIEQDACVLGPLRTEADMRRKGLAAAVLQNAIAFLCRRGYRVFYIDTSRTNIASQKTIARAGFGPPLALLRNGELVKIETER